jgi:curved DNA-binding protein CbpA
VSHYEALGVERTADAASVRRAYLRLAREHHPDRHADDPGRQRQAEDRMRRINAAWSVLGDPARRAHYDLTLADPTSSSSSRARTGPMWEGGPTPGWRPFDESDDDPSPDDLDDTPTGAWRPSAWLAMVPPLFVAAALLLGALGLALGIRQVFAFAVLVAAVGAFLFMLAPLRALSASRAADRLGGD